MPISRPGAAVVVLFMIAMPAIAPATAQQVMSEPAYCAQFYPNANCQNKGPGNPYTDPNYRRGIGQYETQPGGNQTVGVTGKRSRTQRPAATRMQ
jgi:hypothetical protein